jgi:acyl carrier protein
MVDEKLKKEIFATVAEQLGVDVNDVIESKSFIEDLNADSLDLTEMIMTLEEKFNVEITDAKAAELKTVGDVIAFIGSEKKA